METAHFIRHYCHKWKAKSMYQVLLLYRAKRYQDFVYFAQQVMLKKNFLLSTWFCTSPQYPSHRFNSASSVPQAHMYNQSVVWNLQSTREAVDLSSLESRASGDFLEAGNKPNVFKLPFRLQDPVLLGVYSKVDPLGPDRRA